MKIFSGLEVYFCTTIANSSSGVDNDETVAVLSEELLEVPECFGWDLESVLLTVVLSFARWNNDIAVAEMNTGSGLLADSSNQPSSGLAVVG